MNDDELDRVRQLDAQRAAGEPPTDEEVAGVTPHQPPTPESGLSTEMAVMFGQNFGPQPFGYIITRGEVHGTPCLFLTFEHAHGRISFPLSDLEAQGMANRLTQNAKGGIVVAKDMPSSGLKSV